MGNLIRYGVQLKKKNLINKLIKLGIYKKNNKHLYELTLSELEKEYKNMNTNDLVSNSRGS
ncbi:Fur-regulated basic protein FbpA [Neobacillus vireti]|uniref:Fur-regulated basic protein FbpA n=1 Tax=Neobacillus vireti TaxID=220686 RepID=UPI002FFE97BB